MIGDFEAKSIVRLRTNTESKYFSSNNVNDETICSKKTNLLAFQSIKDNLEDSQDKQSLLSNSTDNDKTDQPVDILTTNNSPLLVL